LSIREDIHFNAVVLHRPIFVKKRGNEKPTLSLSVNGAKSFSACPVRGMMKERDERLFKADEAMEAIYFPEVDDGEESEENV